MVHDLSMLISVTEAKAQLTELVRRAETGEEIVLTRHGKPVVRFVPVGSRPSATDKRALLEEMKRARPSRGPAAARSQDFLYREDGLPK